MTEPVEKPPGLFSLLGMESLSTTLRTSVINAGFFIGLLLLIPAVAVQFTRSAVVIDPIAVPKALAKQGLTAEVVANRLWDGLQDFANTSSARRTILAIPDAQLVEFSIPNVGISIDSVFAQFRQFFRIYETRIAGEIICETVECRPEGLRLRVRVIRGTTDVIDLPAQGATSERDYFREAAAGVYELLDPFVAIAAQSETEPVRAKALARRLVLGGHKDAKWAHNLVGDIEMAEGDPEAAIIEYRAALALDPDFNLSRTSLGRALALTGDFEAARAALTDAEAREPDSVKAAEGFALLAELSGDTDEAIRQLRIAADRDPVSPVDLSKAGALELARNNTAEGMALLNEALAVDPGHAESLKLLGDAYAKAQNPAAAEIIFRNWADYVPTSAEAHAGIADMLAAQAKPEDAAAEYDRAADLGLTDPAALRRRADILSSLQRYSQSAPAFAALAAATPDDPNLAFALAESHRHNGHPDLALPEYQRFLSLAPNDPRAPEAETQVKALTAL